MERNSIWNSPPLKTSLETLKTLTERYPEHLGHAIVYKPGMLFSGLWSACKPLLDPKTVRKIIFVRGDVADGSKNDLMLKDILRDDWRALCDRAKDDYDHQSFWAQVLADEAKWNAQKEAAHQHPSQPAQHEEVKSQPVGDEVPTPAAAAAPAPVEEVAPAAQQ